MRLNELIERLTEIRDEDFDGDGDITVQFMGLDGDWQPYFDVYPSFVDRTVTIT